MAFPTDETDRLLSTTRSVRRRLDLERAVDAVGEEGDFLGEELGAVLLVRVLAPELDLLLEVVRRRGRSGASAPAWRASC